MATKNHETTPYWSTSATFPQFGKLAEDVVADVAVVGAGVTGSGDAATVSALPASGGWPDQRLTVGRRLAPARLFRIRLPSRQRDLIEQTGSRRHHRRA